MQNSPAQIATTENKAMNQLGSQGASRLTISANDVGKANTAPNAITAPS
jgi:hypothetical protein